jgi:hypothetical protein
MFATRAAVPTPDPRAGIRASLYLRDMKKIAVSSSRPIRISSMLLHPR